MTIQRASGRASPCPSGCPSGIATVELDTSGMLDVPAEIARTTKDLAAAEKEVADCGRKLGNADFLAKAPEAVVGKIRARADKAAQDVDRLTERLPLVARGWPSDRAIGSSRRSAPTGPAIRWAGTPTRSRAPRTCRAGSRARADAVEIAAATADLDDDVPDGHDGAGAGLAAADPRGSGVAAGHAGATRCRSRRRWTGSPRCWTCWATRRRQLPGDP